MRAPLPLDEHRARRTNAIVVSAVGVALGSVKALLLFAVTGAWFWLLVLPMLVGWAWYRVGKDGYPFRPASLPNQPGGAGAGDSS